ncbi:MAG: nitrous oxide-stimulated promoter family protein [Fibrobacter sp.]|nr:nitrous oxide-stimulated promoter family protein [Fibrobacter sp.]
MTEIDREIETIQLMLSLYCKCKHRSKDLCEQCRDILKYATERLKSCRYGDQKPTCRNCTIHCYKPSMREEVKKVMRFSGPRMIFYHPVIAVKHLWQSLRK